MRVLDTTRQLARTGCQVGAVPDPCRDPAAKYASCHNLAAVPWRMQTSSWHSVTIATIERNWGGGRGRHHLLLCDSGCHRISLLVVPSERCEELAQGRGS